MAKDEINPDLIGKYVKIVIATDNRVREHGSPNSIEGYGYCKIIGLNSNPKERFVVQCSHNENKIFSSDAFERGCIYHKDATEKRSSEDFPIPCLEIRKKQKESDIDYGQYVDSLGFLKDQIVMMVEIFDNQPNMEDLSIEGEESATKHYNTPKMKHEYYHIALDSINDKTPFIDGKTNELDQEAWDNWRKVSKSKNMDQFIEWNNSGFDMKNSVYTFILKEKKKKE